MNWDLNRKQLLLSEWRLDLMCSSVPYKIETHRSVTAATKRIIHRKNLFVVYLFVKGVLNKINSICLLDPEKYSNFKTNQSGASWVEKLREAAAAECSGSSRLANVSEKAKVGRHSVQGRTKSRSCYWASVGMKGTPWKIYVLAAVATKWNGPSATRLVFAQCWLDDKELGGDRQRGNNSSVLPAFTFHIFNSIKTGCWWFLIRARQQSLEGGGSLTLSRTSGIEGVWLAHTECDRPLGFFSYIHCLFFKVPLITQRLPLVLF